jgi:hypothetical protein
MNFAQVSQQIIAANIPQNSTSNLPPPSLSGFQQEGSPCTSAITKLWTAQKANTHPIAARNRQLESRPKVREGTSTSWSLSQSRMVFRFEFPGQSSTMGLLYRGVWSTIRRRLLRYRREGEEKHCVRSPRFHQGI